MNQDLIQCQIACWSHMTKTIVKVRRESPRKQIKMLLKRQLSMKRKRQLKRMYERFFNWRKPAPSTIPITDNTTRGLQPGDLIRVRSKDEIRAMLNAWNESKGCGFMSGMWQYCDTTQRVLKPVQQFLDERDYRLKKCSNIVLLEGVVCEGMEEYGLCDRSCFFFWREEWLEKL